MHAMLAVAMLASMSACAAWGVARRPAPVEEPGTSELALRVGSDTRTYLLHVPTRRPRRFGRAAPYPLVIVLHGSGAAGQTIRDMSQLDSLADATPMLVAYPDATRNWLGLQSGWNAGTCCGPAARNAVDDIGFLRALIEHVARSLPVDRRRVYVAGFSDGARMAYRVGCELSTQVAAIAVVAGSLVDPDCRPTRPVPAIAFHGTADPEVAFTDSSYSSSTRPLVPTSIPVPPAVQFWAANDGCRAATVDSASASVKRVRYTGCAADVLFFSITGGGHGWPGDDSDGDDTSAAMRELDASRELVRFFLRHPRPS